MISKHDERRILKNILATVISLLLGFAAYPAIAASILASASIDWSTFRVTTIDIGIGMPSITWDTQSDSTSLFGAPGSPAGLSQTSNSSNWNGTSVSYSDANGSFTTSAQTSPNMVSANVSVATSDFDYRYVGSIFERSGTFTVRGSGELLFEVNYNLVHDNLNISDKYFFGSSSLSFFAEANQIGDGPSVFCDTPLLCLIGNSVSGGQDGDTGTLSIRLTAGDGWIGSLAISGRTAVTQPLTPPPPPGSVPVPAGIWLFGSSLIGLIGWRRRQPGNGAWDVPYLTCSDN